MRLLFLSAKASGGAFIGAKRRAAALRKAGIEIDFYVICRSEDDRIRSPEVMKIENKYLNFEVNSTTSREEIFNKTIIMPRTHHDDAYELFTYPKSLVNRDFWIYVATNYDAISFNWMSGMLNYDDLKVLQDKKIIWHLSDMNAFTGGCHFSSGCKLYSNSCETCPALPQKHQSNANKAWGEKLNGLKHLKKLCIITPSQYLKIHAEKSSILGNLEIHHLSNPAPIEKFQYLNKFTSRIKLGLALNKHYILFIADNINNPRKGLKHFESALEKLKDSKRLTLIIYGGGGVICSKLKDIDHVYIDRNVFQDLNLVYSAADLTVFPSLEENAPLIPIESILSGTSVICHDVGDIAEYADNKMIRLCKKTSDGLLAEIKGFFESYQSINFHDYVKIKNKIRVIFSESSFCASYLSICRNNH